jgi:para-aminobenzoate synthetase/4-amino-4-deoxychorismate lyase
VAFLNSSVPEFELIETLLLVDGVLTLSERHLERLRDSARYFGFAWRESAVRGLYSQWLEQYPHGSWRIRLLLARDGEITTDIQPQTSVATALKVALAPESIDSREIFLFHKTSHRAIYDTLRCRRPDVDELVHWNERQELTESSIANLVLQIDGKLLTPPRSCGLLAGTFRQELLEKGIIKERILTRDALQHAEKIFLVNSVRGWMTAELVP